MIAEAWLRLAGLGWAWLGLATKPHGHSEFPGVGDTYEAYLRWAGHCFGSNFRACQPRQLTIPAISSYSSYSGKHPHNACGKAFPSLPPISYPLLQLQSRGGSFWIFWVYGILANGGIVDTLVSSLSRHLLRVSSTVPLLPSRPLLINFSIPPLHTSLCLRPFASRRNIV